MMWKQNRNCNWLQVKIIENLSGNASRPNIKAKGLECRPERFFDVKVINTHSPSQIHLTTESILKKYEQEKDEIVTDIL